ncbi:Rpn family recombination-promoting nuclease/putative transposase [Desulfobacter postgatei]|uniref:Rpn family recombination-promoting nuclease/putative transposase n=1 Tax=Desulfobacter postgatei TaxID=2293 RepID=UPI0005871385
MAVSGQETVYRETWSDLASAKSFLQNYLPGKVLDVARLDTLEICKDSFIEPDLKDYYSRKYTDTLLIY